MKNWRSTAGFTAFFLVDSNKVYLASNEKKSYQVAVSNLIKTDEYTSENYVENKIDQVKIILEENSNLRLEIKSSLFPTDNWYSLMNFSQSTLGMLITQTTVIDGLIDASFEIIFNSLDPTQVSLITPTMTEYKDCLSEMARRLSYDLGKKTKKWIPGHKYELENGTYIYLGSYLSRKKDSAKGEFQKDLSMAPVNLYVSSLKDGETKVSDIFNNRPFDCVAEDGIKMLYGTIKSAIDAGEVLTNDLASDVSTYWETLLDNTSKRFLTKTVFDREIYLNLRDILDIFSVQTEDSLNYSTLITPELKDKIINIVKIWTWNIIVSKWNDSRSVGSFCIGDKESKSDNIKRLSSLVVYTIRDENKFSTSYYIELFKELGINLDSISEELIDKWKNDFVPKLNTDFDTYLNVFEQFETVGDRHVNLRDKSLIGYRNNDVSVKKFYGEGELFNSISSLSSHALMNHGAGISEYKTFKVGTVRNPKYYTKITINLVDLLNYINSELELTETLKNEIMNSKFTSVCIEVDSDAETIR